MEIRVKRISGEHCNSIVLRQKCAWWAGRLGKQQSYRGEWYETKIIRPQDVQGFVKWVRSLDFTEVQCKVIGNCSAGGCVLFLETHSGRCRENGWWEVQRWSWETGCEAAALSGWKMMVTLVEWKEMVGFIVWLFGNRVNGTWLWINMGVEEKRITFIVPSYDTISINNYGNFGREFKFFGDFGYSFVTCALLFSCDRLFCDPMDCSPPGSSVYGIFQARILEWVAISSSTGSS